MSACGIVLPDGRRVDFSSLDDMRVWLRAVRRGEKKIDDAQNAPEANPATLPEAALGLIETAVGWARAGFPRVGENEYDARKKICEACEHWEPQAYAGAGRCALCKCGPLKLWLATAKCKIKKW